MTRHRRSLSMIGLLGWCLAVAAGVAGGAAAASPSAPPPGPPFPPPTVGRAVYDYAGVLSSEAIASAEFDHRRHRGENGGRDRRLHPGQRRV